MKKLSLFVPLVFFCSILLSLNARAADLAILNAGVSNITTTSAWVFASVTTNATNPTITVYYGTSDADTNAASWEYTNLYGAAGTGVSSNQLTNLTASQLYYWRWYALDSVTNQTDWANSTSNFWTLAGVPTGTPPTHLYYPVMVDSNGVVAAPTNFWETNDVASAADLAAVSNTVDDHTAHILSISNDVDAAEAGLTSVSNTVDDHTAHILSISNDLDAAEAGLTSVSNTVDDHTAHILSISNDVDQLNTQSNDYLRLDGGTTPTADIPMGGHAFTNLVGIWVNGDFYIRASVNGAGDFQIGDTNFVENCPSTIGLAAIDNLVLACTGNSGFYFGPGTHTFNPDNLVWDIDGTFTVETDTAQNISYGSTNIFVHGIRVASNAEFLDYLVSIGLVKTNDTRTLDWSGATITVADPSTSASNAGEIVTSKKLMDTAAAEGWDDLEAVWYTLSVQDPTNSLAYWLPNPYAESVTLSEVYVKTHGMTCTVEVVKQDRTDAWYTYTGMKTNIAGTATGTSDTNLFSNTITNYQRMGFVPTGISAFAVTNFISVDFEFER